MALVAELVAPRPQAPGQTVQAVLVGEADGAVHLMRDLGDLAGGFAGAILAAATASARRGTGRGDGDGGALDGDRRGRRLFGEQRQLLLDRLELGDRAAELDAVVGIAGRQGERGFHRARHLRRAKQRAEALHQAHVDRIGQRRRAAARLDRAEMVARLAGEVLAGGEIAAPCGTTSSVLPAISTTAAASRAHGT